MLSPSSDELPVLRLGNPRAPWLLSELAVRAWAEAAAVCLDEVGHRSGVEASIDGVPGVTRVFLDQAIEGTRIDYWLGRRGEGLAYQALSRIEISGILREAPNNTVEYRIHQKRERLRKNSDDRNATIAVVAFSTPKAVMEREHEPEL